MAQHDDNLEIEVRIEGNGERARLCIPSGIPVEFIDLPLLRMTLENRGVIVDDQVARRLGEIVHAFREDPFDVDALVAEAIPPIHGLDGRFDWVEGRDPTLLRREADGESSDGHIDHYNQVQYIHVSAGDHVATLKAPTRGTDGRDVTGEPIKARPGRPTFTRCDETFDVGADGHIRAQLDGVLSLESGVVSVVRLLETRNFADFTTGNIDFDGRVVIRRGVRDRFVVKATESIVVHGMVEAAQIVCDGDLDLQTGMAGKGRGTIEVGGRMRAVYLDQISGFIRGDLSVRRELIGCRLAVGAAVKAGLGAMIGGELTVAREAAFHTAGSEAGVETLLKLGRDPVAVKRLSAIGGRLEQLEHDLVERTTGADERAEKIQDEMGRLTAEREQIELGLQSLRADLRIAGVVWPNVIIETASSKARLYRPLRGPAQLLVNTAGELCYRVADGPTRSISDIARPGARAA